MVNGSGLTITLQFNNAAFLADESTRTVIEVNEDGVEEELEERRATEFHINFHNDNSDADGGGDNYFHSVRVYNSGDEQLNIYDSGSQDDYFTLDSSADSITTIKVNYTIKNNYLHYSYELNGAASEEYVFTKNGEVNPEIEWRPSFGLSSTASTIYTVTDVTFISAPVPEPATATLSLLALAGLATRRLRK